MVHDDKKKNQKDDGIQNDLGEDFKKQAHIVKDEIPVIPPPPPPPDIPQ